MESFEYVGEWWLPGQCDQKVQGKLSFAPNDWAKLEITIEGQSDTPLLTESHPLKPFPIVLGTMNASSVTLCSCSLVSYPFAMSQDQISRKYIFLIRTVLVGAHFKSLDDIMLDELTLEYTHLTEWMDHLNFGVNHSAENAGFTVTYTPFDPIQVTVKEFNIEFGYYGDFRPWLPQTSWITLMDQAYISLRPQSGETMSFWDYLPFVNFYLPTLLTMATGTYNYPLNVNAQTSRDNDSGLTIYYPIPGYQEKSQNIARWNMLFGFADLNENGMLEERLSNWVSICEKLRTVLDLYFRFYYLKDLDTETKFLFIAQMMEAYQKALYGGKYPTEQPYKVVIDSLIDAIPPWVQDPLRKKLKTMIRNGNKFSLNSRIMYLLEEVLSDHVSLIRSMVGNYQDFADKVAGLRNNLSHRSPRPIEEIVPKAELPELVAHAETILRLCFLVKIGFTTEEIKSLWQKYGSKPIRY